MDESASDVTHILLELRNDETSSEPASDRLYSTVYAELKKTASALMRRERIDHTLQPTALVHEAYLRLVDQTRVQWQDRAHFFGIAARAMRQILIDHARKHRAEKRGGGFQRITFDENIGVAEEPDLDLLALHDALDKLGREDPRMARIVELRVFGGLAAREAAHVLGISKRTADTDWKFAKLWLARELTGGSSG